VVAFRAPAFRHAPRATARRAKEFPRSSRAWPASTSDYIYTQLNAFRVEARANDGAKMMRSIAVKMTDADMKAVASYIQACVKLNVRT